MTTANGHLGGIVSRASYLRVYIDAPFEPYMYMLMEAKRCMHAHAQTIVLPAREVLGLYMLRDAVDI